MQLLAWSVLHEPNFSGFRFGGSNVVIGYPVIPYIGIISFGFCIGNLFTSDVSPVDRKRILRNLGIGAILLFIVLRWSNTYGNPSPWTEQKNFLITVFSFVNTTKYPPSLLFILMPLGPALLFLLPRPWRNRERRWPRRSPHGGTAGAARKGGS